MTIPNTIAILSGRDAVRRRPGMYIGSTDRRGLHHLVFELIDNAVDERLAGYGDHIQIELFEDGACSVTDNGRGIPVQVIPKMVEVHVSGLDDTARWFEVWRWGL